MEETLATAHEKRGRVKNVPDGLILYSKENRRSGKMRGGRKKE